MGFVAAALILGVCTSESFAQKEPRKQYKESYSQLPGQEEFGMYEEELIAAVEKVEALISKYMRQEGFEYVANDFETISKGMNADKVLPGAPEGKAQEKLFFDMWGYGISTTYTGKPVQLTEGYNPGRVGIGKKNIAIFKSLSPADQVAYNRALLGEGGVPFAVAIEIEDLYRAKGITFKAISEVFSEEQVKSTYYNPLNEMLNSDPRFIKGLELFMTKLADAGFHYTHVDRIERDLRNRLDRITGNQTIPIEKLSPEQKAALKELQAYEKALAKVAFPLETNVLDPIETAIIEDLYGDKEK
jgi:hypothetical protein